MLKIPATNTSTKNNITSGSLTPLTTIRAIANKLATVNLSDNTALNADVLMYMLTEIINGIYGLKATVYDTYNELAIATKEEGQIYYCLEDQQYYGYKGTGDIDNPTGLVILG